MLKKKEKKKYIYIPIDIFLFLQNRKQNGKNNEINHRLLNIQTTVSF